jgi:hypothetical protein
VIDGSERRIETFLLIRRLQIFRSAENFETFGDLNAQTQDDTEPQDELESDGHDFRKASVLPLSSGTWTFLNGKNEDFHCFHYLTQLNGTLENWKL